MTWRVLTVQASATAAPTVCAVDAERVQFGDGSAQFFLADQLVYQVPLALLLRQTEHADVATARDEMRQRQRELRGKGRLGQEHAGVRPAAGAVAVRAAVIESVRAVLASDKEHP